MVVYSCLPPLIYSFPSPCQLSPFPAGFNVPISGPAEICQFRLESHQLLGLEVYAFHQRIVISQISTNPTIHRTASPSVVTTGRGHPGWNSPRITWRRSLISSVNPQLPLLKPTPALALEAARWGGGGHKKGGGGRCGLESLHIDPNVFCQVCHSDLIGHSLT